jgi:hypothetical protein
MGRVTQWHDRTVEVAAEREIEGVNGEGAHENG